MVVGAITTVAPALLPETRSVVVSTWVVNKALICRVGSIRGSLHLTSYTSIRNKAFLRYEVVDCNVYGSQKASSGGVTVNIAAVALHDASADSDSNLQPPVFYMRKLDGASSNFVVYIETYWPVESDKFNGNVTVKLGSPVITISPDACWTSGLARFIKDACDDQIRLSKNRMQHIPRQSVLQRMKSQWDRWIENAIVNSFRPLITVDISAITLRVIAVQKDMIIAPIVFSVRAVSVSTESIDISENANGHHFGKGEILDRSKITNEEGDLGDSYLLTFRDISIAFADVDVLSRFSIDIEIVRSIGNLVPSQAPLQIHCLIEEMSLMLHPLFCKALVELANHALPEESPTCDSNVSDEDLEFYDTKSAPPSNHSPQSTSLESYSSSNKAVKQEVPAIHTEDALQKIESLQREISLLRSQALSSEMLNAPAAGLAELKITHLEEELSHLKSEYVESLLLAQLKLLDQSEKISYDESFILDKEADKRCSISQLLAFDVINKTVPYVREYVFVHRYNDDQILFSLDFNLLMLRCEILCPSDAQLHFILDHLQVDVNWGALALNSVMQLSSLCISLDEDEFCSLVCNDFHDCFARSDYICRFPSREKVEENVVLLLGNFSLWVSPKLCSNVFDFIAVSGVKSPHTNSSKENPFSNHSRLPAYSNDPYYLDISCSFHNLTFEIKKDNAIERAFSFSLQRNSLHYNVQPSILLVEISVERCLLSLFNEPILSKIDESPFFHLLVQPMPSHPDSFHGVVALPRMEFQLNLSLLYDLKLLIESTLGMHAKRQIPAPTRCAPNKPHHLSHLRSPLDHLSSLFGFHSGIFSFQMRSNKLRLNNGVSSLEAGFDSFHANYTFGSHCNFGGCALVVVWTGVRAKCNDFNVLDPVETRIHAVALPPLSSSSTSSRTDSVDFSQPDDSKSLQQRQRDGDRIPLRRNELQIYFNVSSINLNIRPKVALFLREMLVILETKTQISTPRPMDEVGFSNEGMNAGTDFDVLNFLGLRVLLSVHISLEPIHIELYGGDDSGAEIKGLEKLTIQAQNIGVDAHSDLLHNAIAGQYEGGFKLGFHLSALKADSFTDGRKEALLLVTSFDENWLLMRVAVSSEGSIKSKLDYGGIFINGHLGMTEIVELFELYKVIQTEPSPLEMKVNSHTFPSSAPIHLGKQEREDRSLIQREIHLSQKSFALPFGLRNFSLSVSLNKFEILLPLVNGQSFIFRCGPFQQVTFSRDIDWAGLERPFGAYENERSGSFLINEFKLLSIECSVLLPDSSETMQLLEPFQIQVSHALQLSQVESEFGDRKHYISVVNNLRIRVTPVVALFDSNYYWLTLIVDTILKPVTIRAASIRMSKTAAGIKSEVKTCISPATLSELISTCFTTADFQFNLIVPAITGILTSRSNNCHLVLLRLALNGVQINFVSTNKAKPQGFLAFMAKLETSDCSQVRMLSLIDPFELMLNFTIPQKARILCIFPSLSRSKSFMFAVPDSALALSFSTLGAINLNIGPKCAHVLRSISFESSATQDLSLSRPHVTIRNLCGAVIYFRIAETDSSFACLPHGQTGTVFTKANILSDLIGNTTSMKVVEIKVMASTFRFKVVNNEDGMSLDVEGHRIHGIWEESCGQRVLILSTTTRIFNYLKDDIELRGDDPLHPWGLTLKAQTNEYLPYFYRANSLFTISAVGNGECVQFPFSDLVQSGNVFFAKLSLGNIHCIAEVTTNTEVLGHMTTINLRPMVTILNALACDIELAILNTPREQIGETHFISPAHSISFVSLRSDEAFYFTLTLRLPGSPVLLAPFRVDGVKDDEVQEMQSLVYVQFGCGTELPLSIEVKCSMGSRVVWVFVPYWLVSMSSQNISYRYEEVEESIAGTNGRDDLAADQFLTPIEISENIFPQVCDQQRRFIAIAHIGQTHDEHQSSRISLRVNESKFSRSFPLAYNGSTAIDVTSTDSSTPGSFLSWAAGLNCR